MTNEERIYRLKQIEKDICVCSLDATFEETAKSCAIRSAIEELEERRWIPVTERLPEDEVDVLIYTTDKKINKAYRRHKSWVENQMEWLVFETLGYGYIYDDDKVLAWMPLPEPYEEGADK